MKKFLLMSVLALPFLAASEQSASAWKCIKFGCGLNFEYSSGGNCFGWGLWTNGPGPGCCPPGCVPPCGMPYGGPFYGPMPAGPDCGMPGYDLGYNPPAPTGIHPVQYDGYQPVNYYQPSGWYGW